MIDGLVEAGVLQDDNHGVIGVPVYDWQYTAAGQGKVWITVEETV